MSRLRCLWALSWILVVPSVALEANRVEIKSTGTVNWSCATATIHIAVENDADLDAISIPLVARALQGDGFWALTLDTAQSSGRLATSLTGIRSLDRGRVDFISPDPFLLYYQASGPGDCLPAGPSQDMISLTCHVVPWSGGQFEIDTMTYAPGIRPSLVRCSDGEPLPLDQFVKGIVEVRDFPGLCEGLISSIDSTSITKWSGAVVTNWAHAIYVSGSVRYYLRQGPGVVDSTTGLWTWASSPADSGDQTVAIQVNDAACPQVDCAHTRLTFVVHLRHVVPGDINCDGVADVLDVVREIGHAFRGEPAPVPCTDL